MHMEGLNRITFNPAVMGGRASIRDTRLTVALIINLLANGMTRQEILAAYPYLEDEDISQALRYAALLAEDTLIELPAEPVV